MILTEAPDIHNPVERCLPLIGHEDYSDITSEKLFLYHTNNLTLWDHMEYSDSVSFKMILLFSERKKKSWSSHCGAMVNKSDWEP